MAGGGLSCLRCAFTCSVVALLGVGLHHGVAATVDIHRKVGDAAELPSDLSSPDNVTEATWKHKYKVVAMIGGSEPEDPRLKGRVTLNSHNFSLTVTNLTTEDSGLYIFTFDNAKKQDGSTINLQVHEPLTQEPVVTFVNSTWSPLNQSCTLFLECSVTSSPGHVSFTWTVGGETRTGPLVQHLLRPEDGATTFTCEASNHISNTSAFRSEHCGNETLTQGAGLWSSTMVVAAAAGAASVMVVLLATIVAVCFFRRKQAGGDLGEGSLYASISDLSPQATTTVTASMYDTIHKVNTISSTSSPNPKPLKPHTVYDEIQMHRVQTQSTYQEIH